MPGEVMTSVRRSCLSVPGSDAKKISKAAETGADEIILDLEDAVRSADKDSARELVASWLGRARRAYGGVAVRVNAPRTQWCHSDILACVQVAGPAMSIVLPKVENAGDLAFVDRLLDGAEASVGRSERVTVQALIETAEGLVNLREIVSASPRLSSLILGYADLGASLGRAPDAPAESWYTAQDTILTAARSAGVAAIDGPYLGVGVDSALTAHLHHVARLGFDGKWVIHPRQIEAVNDAFSPGADEVEHARKVLDALEEGHACGAGAVALDGQMIDEAVAVRARGVLARAREAVT